MKRTVFAAVIGFALGVLARDVTQDRLDEERKAELGARAYACSGYLVADKHGDHECRLLQPRFEPWWPIPGDPVRLRRREIRGAVGGRP